MITIHPDHTALLSSYRSVDDFLKIDIEIVRSAGPVRYWTSSFI
ncbi:MAG: hypothetical protein ACYS9H_07845 [Planctomycetota bacterium]|jgi:hypothetical protein